jgi:hypothetical protein
LVVIIKGFKLKVDIFIMLDLWCEFLFFGFIFRIHSKFQLLYYFKVAKYDQQTV